MVKLKYRQVCPIARALDHIGEKWSLLIIRDLMRKGGPMRFQDFEKTLPGIATSTLSARLKALEAQGAIGHRLYEEHPPRYEYFLTEQGKALLPVVRALHQWGESYARGGQQKERST